MSTILLISESSFLLKKSIIIWTVCYNFQVDNQNKKMKEAMEDLNFDVPMLTDAKMGATSWARLK